MGFLGLTMDDPARDPAPAPEQDASRSEVVKTTTFSASPQLQPTSAQSTAPTGAMTAFVDYLLGFLGNASNETLGASLVGLALVTYLLLGRVGLLLIGLAGGIILQATWDGTRTQGDDGIGAKVQQKRMQESNLDIAQRLLEWRATARDSEDVPWQRRLYASPELDYSEFGPETAAALEAFTDAVVKDYVHYWYDPTLPGEQLFPAACRQVLIAFILSLCDHLGRKRPANAFLDFVTNASSMILVFLSELATALNASPNAPAEEAVALYLAAKPDSSLSYMLNEVTQKLKLADAAEDIIQAYLDSKSYNCPPVHVFLSQVLAQLVLESTVTLCSRPDWINDWIVYGLEESKTTMKVMDMVDAGVESGNTRGKQKDSTPQTSPANRNTRPSDRTRSDDVQSIGPEKPSINAVNQSTEVENTSNGADTAPFKIPQSEHRRKISKAEEAMDEAMREARRLTQMILEEDERRTREEKDKEIPSTNAEMREDQRTPDVSTPASSQDEGDSRENGNKCDVAVDFRTQTTNDNYSPMKSSTASTERFADFDQILASTTSNAQSDAASEAMENVRREMSQFTLHNANISIFDDSAPGERSSIKAKPTTDYLIQIEPADSNFAGWMIPRKYADFETLHEVLRRISVITGTHFTDAHAELPKWRVHTKVSLREELERYLSDAVHLQPLAESEGMKRFLEKERGLSKTPNSTASKAFGWPTPDAFGKLGGDMINVLARAPKQVAGGSRGMFGGVAGLVAGSRKTNQSQSNISQAVIQESSPAKDTGPTASGHTRPNSGTKPMTDSVVSASSADSESLDFPNTPSTYLSDSRDSEAVRSNTNVRSPTPSTSQHRTLSMHSGVSPPSDPGSLVSNLSPDDPSTSQLTPEETLNLPPPPSEMPADYTAEEYTGRFSKDSTRPPAEELAQSKLAAGLKTTEPANPPKSTPGSQAKSQAIPKTPLTERETSVTVELIFAVITELYTLSSVWQIRRTLLSAAKSFLLRPGNPQLASIRNLLQSSLLDANLSDSGLAHHIYKLRENGLPTEAELDAWKRDYPEKTAEQKEELRIKARKLLVTKGLPQALTSVMGVAGSREALGKVFDCLQVESISRGLVFGLMLQALRVVAH